MLLRASGLRATRRPEEGHRAHGDPCPEDHHVVFEKDAFRCEECPLWAERPAGDLPDGGPTKCYAPDTVTTHAEEH